MNIEKNRSAFTVHVFDPLASRGAFLTSALTEVGYNCLHFSEGADVLKNIPHMPPHILFMVNNSQWKQQKTWIREINEISPETHIIVMGLPEDLDTLAIQYSSYVYEVLGCDWGRDTFTESQLATSFSPVLAAADRAATLDYFRYMNEQLQERVMDRPERSDPTLAMFSIWARQLKHKKSMRSLLEHTGAEISRYLGAAAVIYFKYMEAYKTLVPFTSNNFDLKEFSGLGVDLKQEKCEVEDLLEAPKNILGLGDLINEVTGISEMSLFRLIHNDLVGGVFVALERDISESEIYIKTCLETAGIAATSIDLEKSFHEVNHRDEGSGALNLKYFSMQMEAEISRSRRLQMPTSMALFEIDDYAEIENQIGARDCRYLMRMVYTIIAQNIRVNDFVGRVGRDTFAVSFPHTGDKGAAIKAEQIRSMVEGANFSKILPQWVRVTLSIGVTEYPSHCHDLDDMFRRTDEALQKVKESGKNLVCLAAPPIGFVPDFVFEGTN